MRAEIERLLSLGAFPLESRASPEHVKSVQALVAGIYPPLTDQEAAALVKLFGPDTFFGLAWTLLHLIETAPDWPIQDCLPIEIENEWVRLLRQRAKMP